MKHITKRENGRTRVTHSFPEPSLTEQAHKDRVNINTIMQRAIRTGMQPLQKTGAIYGDFSQVDDYQSMITRIESAKEEFLTLPADLRKRFNHDPGQLIEFVQNPENASELIAMGLAEDPNQPPNVRLGDPVPVPEATETSETPSTEG